MQERGSILHLTVCDREERGRDGLRGPEGKKVAFPQKNSLHSAACFTPLLHPLFCQPRGLDTQKSHPLLAPLSLRPFYWKKTFLPVKNSSRTLTALKADVFEPTDTNKLQRKQKIQIKSEKSTKIKWTRWREGTMLSQSRKKILCQEH